jgi:molybdate transport repressor ModE-like protein
MELLARVVSCGSISQAARAMKMSYKAAWDAIELMETLTGSALVERSAGGKGGGGSRLTRDGEQLVADFRAIQLEHRCFVDGLTLQSNASPNARNSPERRRMASAPRDRSRELPGKSDNYFPELQYIEPVARPGIVDKYLPTKWRDTVPLPTHIRKGFALDGRVETCIGYDVTNQVCFSCYVKYPDRNATNIQHFEDVDSSSEEAYAWRLSMGRWLVFRITSSDQGPPQAFYEFSPEIPW